jgi:menaquinone-dependent protoporphyrinogen oxidase
MTVLVLYATAHGSTQGIAERVAQRLNDKGHDAVARPVNVPDGLADARAVVVGSAVHHGQWLADADDLLRRYTSRLRDRPVWLFSVCSVGERSSYFGPRVTTFLRQRRDAHLPLAQRERLASVDPVDHHDFAGAVGRRGWGRAGTLLLRALGGTTGDHRDWAEVEAWADTIAEQLTASTALAEPVRALAPAPA